MHTKKHILITSSRLDVPGGIERAVVATANLFAAKGHQVSVLVLDEQQTSFYPVSDSVTLYHSSMHFGVGIKGNTVSRKLQLAKDLIRLRSLVKEIAPDVIIASDYVQVVCLRLVVPQRIRLFSWEHHHYNWLKKNKFWKTLLQLTYPRLSGVICLNSTEELFFKNKGCQTVVIPNFISNKVYKRNLTSNKTILTVGWLIKRKGVDLIPPIAKNVFALFPDWKWKIIGEGDEKANLVKAIKEFNLASQIEIIKPKSPDLTHEYNSADFYVMTSRLECFPMVLLEAMSMGLPIISFDCPTGPSDIVMHEKDGILVEGESVAAMTSAILNLITNPTKRHTMSENAHANIQRFNQDVVYVLWEKLLNDK